MILKIKWAEVKTRKMIDDFRMSMPAEQQMPTLHQENREQLRGDNELDNELVI